MFDIVLEIIRAIVIALVLGILWVKGRRYGINNNSGWTYLVSGFSLLFFASLIDITDSFPELNRYVFIGDTVVESFIEKVFGYLTGFVLLAIGFWKWLPIIAKVNAANDSLVVTMSLLESMVLEHTGKLEDEISERKDIEKVLLENKMHLQSVVNNAIDGIITINESGEICEFNPAAEKIFGYSSIEVLGKNITVLMPEQYRADHGDKIKHYVKTGKAKVLGVGRELNGIHKDGALIPLEFSMYETRKNQERFFTSILRNITERKNAEIEKEKLNTQLQQAQKMEALGKLTGGIAHDFNNILASIMGFTLLAIDKYTGKVDEKLELYLDETYRAGERARDLIEQMLAFSRSSKSEARILSLEPIVKETVKMLQATLPSTIQLQLHTQDPLAKVKIDPVQVNQIVMNLCINARDAIDGQGQIDINIKYKDIMAEICHTCHEKIQGEYVEVSVTDNGSGIKSENLSRIFEPFFTSKDIGEGTGMGLSIVHGIMLDVGGHVQVESIQSEGSTFRLLFPTISDIDDNNEKEEQAPKLIEAYKGNILIVDDDKSVGLFLAELLKNYGFNITFMSNSLAALDLFKQDIHAFDLLVTDQTMPLLSGDKLVGEILLLRSDFPIILMTGYSNVIDKEGAEALGVSSFLTKPLDRDILIDTIKKLLN